jgi:hypothetical protein
VVNWHVDCERGCHVRQASSAGLFDLGKFIIRKAVEGSVFGLGEGETSQKEQGQNGDAIPPCRPKWRVRGANKGSSDHGEHFKQQIYDPDISALRGPGSLCRMKSLPICVGANKVECFPRLTIDHASFSDLCGASLLLD